jgi:negative regulator of sigma E activity
LSSSHDAGGASRREFLRRVAAAGVAAAVTPAVALFAQTPPTPQPAPGTPAPQTPPAAGTPSEEARALAAVLEKRFGDRLTREQWDGVASDLDGDLAAGKRLAAVKLANADEPDFAFRA